jgi:hypothetical protein
MTEWADKKFHRLYVSALLERGQEVPSDPRLRAPSVQEIIKADEYCMRQCGKMISDGHSLDEALQHVARPFGEIHDFLRPQLVLAKAETKGKGRGSGRSMPDRANWAAKHDGKKFCFAYHAAGCNYEDCSFLHRCPVLLSDGKPCMGKHRASACDGKRKAAAVLTPAEGKVKKTKKKQQN